MIYVASDHGGYELKEYIVDYLKKKKIDVVDLTEELVKTDDYPDIAEILCKKVLSHESIGIGICGTGIGISIACNKIRGIRAALCTSKEMIEMAIKHNNANIICLGGRLKTSQNRDEIRYMIDEIFMNQFEEDRHIRRIEKINKLEEK